MSIAAVVAFWTVFFHNCYKFCISFDKEKIYFLGNSIGIGQEVELCISMKIFEVKNGGMELYLTTCPTPNKIEFNFQKIFP